MSSSVNSGVWSRVKGSRHEGRRGRHPGRRERGHRPFLRARRRPAAPERTASGYRDYRPETVERIALTRELQAVGFTLARGSRRARRPRRRRRDLRIRAVAPRRSSVSASTPGSPSSTLYASSIVAAQNACASGRCRFTSA